MVNFETCGRSSHFFQMGVPSKSISLSEWWSLWIRGDSSKRRSHKILVSLTNQRMFPNRVYNSTIMQNKSKLATLSIDDIWRKMRLLFTQCGKRIFSVIQIFREINFWESRSYKIAVFAIFGALNFVNLVIYSLQKVQKFLKIKIQSL